MAVRHITLDSSVVTTCVSLINWDALLVSLNFALAFRVSHWHWVPHKSLLTASVPRQRLVILGP